MNPRLNKKTTIFKVSALFISIIKLIITFCSQLSNILFIELDLKLRKTN